MKKLTPIPNDGTQLTEFVPIKTLVHHESEIDQIKNRIKRLEALLNDDHPPKWLTDELRTDYTTELTLRKCELTLLMLPED